MSKPWKKIYNSINQRCRDKRNRFYCQKGIKNFLTVDEVKYLWYRDKANLMKKPSISRKDHTKNYYLYNCQFIEHKKHQAIKRPNDIKLATCKVCDSIQIYTRLDGAEVCRKCGYVHKEKK